MNNMKRFSIKALAIFLSVLMVLTTFPLTVLAQEQTSEAVSEEVKTESRILEITSERTASTKTFRLPDGSYTVAQYETNVHYLDAYGNWQDIDNSLSVAGSEITTSNARVKFTKKTAGNGQVFTLHDGNQKLTLFLDGAAKKVDAEITNHNTQFGEDTPVLQKITTLDNVSAAVQYTEILPGVDLEYVINGLDIKENIIVKEKADNYSYSFTMVLNNLSARQEESGTIILSNLDGVAAYYIPAPMMWDATNTRSHAVNSTLVDLGNGKYTLTVTADSAWMNAEERVFPITIDPPLCTQPSSNVLDISFNAEGEPPDDSNVLYVSDLWTAYWKLTTLPTLPRGAYITKATFGATLCDTERDLFCVAVYDVVSDWDEETWGTLSDNYIDYIGIDAEFEGDYTWNITPIVQKWYKGQNYGLALMPTDYETMNVPTAFYSSDSSTQTVRPRLCITYRDMKGMEDYWSFSSQSAGFAGTGSINHANGNLVFTIPTLTTTDALMPITPTLVYDSAMANKTYVYGNAQVPDTTAYSPVGMRLNLHETLIKKTFNTYTTVVGEIGVVTEAKNYIVWSDSDGTEHYFTHHTTDSDSGDEIYTDEDGMLLTLKVHTDGTCTMIDSNKNKRTFHTTTVKPSEVEQAWLLTSIEDKSGNQLIFGVLSSGKILSMNLQPNGQEAFNQLMIEYNTNGMPLAVWNPRSGEAVVFAYSSTATGAIVTSGGTYLRQVKRVHGTKGASSWASFSTNMTTDATASYVYDASGRLTTVTNNLTDYTLQYTYNTAGKVSAVQERGVDPETLSTVNGQNFSVTYGSSSTVIRTSGNDDTLGTTDDLLTTYLFDKNGRTIGCYTTDLGRTQIYGASYGEYVSEEENEKAKNNLKSSVQTAQQSPNYLLNGGFENESNGLLKWSTSGMVDDIAMPYEGEGAVSLSISSSVTSSSISQNVYLEPGEYTLSAYVDSYDVVSGSAYLKAGSNSVLISTDKSEASISFSFAQLTFTVTTAQTYTISVQLTGSSSAGEYISVDNVMLARTIGACEFDMLSAGHFESTNGSPSSYWSYAPNSTREITVVDSGLDAFGNVLELPSTLWSYERVSQTVPIATVAMKGSYDEGEPSGVGSVVFRLSGWGKGTAQSFSYRGVFQIRVQLNYYGETEASEQYEIQTFAFDKGITDWQYLSATVQSDPYKLLDSVTVMLEYYGNPGEGYFNDISLVRDSSMVELYAYGDNGKPCAYQSGRITEWYSYNERDNLERTVSSDDSVIFYEYDEEQPDILIYEGYYRFTGGVECTPNVITTSNVRPKYYVTYNYNDFGLVKTTKVIDAQNTTNMSVATTAYIETEGSHIIGKVSTETDTLGQVTRYFWDESNGNLLAVTYPNGNGVCYSYDAMGNLTEVLPATYQSASYTATANSASVDYGYDANTKRLSTITTDSTTYTFAYDGFGNTTQIQAGNNTLASYTYHAGNGKLELLTYGNGNKVKYLYDVLDRIEKIQYNVNGRNNFETVFSYEYDAQGRIRSITDHRTNEVTMYQYDSKGQLDFSFVYDKTTGKTITGTQIRYDGKSRVSVVNQQFECNSATGLTTAWISYVYTYDELSGYVDFMRFGTVQMGATVTPTYNAFGQLENKVVDVDIDDTQSFYSSYTYAYKKESIYLSALVSQLTVKAGQSASSNTTTTYNYTYDANGNITQITDGNGSVAYKYTYDALGQLIREDNGYLNKSYTYTYDKAGNILSKKTYAFSTGTLGAVQSTFSYSYDDASWGDLLTTVGDDDVAYDEIGNPLYIGYTSDGEIFDSAYELIWEGRQLVTHRYREYYYEDDIEYFDEVTYTYNADGIRTSKTVEGIKHEYILNGSQIIAETWTESGVEYVLFYFYDETGAPLGIRYRTSNYAANDYDYFYFEKNLQGDIVAVYNESGTQIGLYYYDAWGNFTTYSFGSTGLERYIVEDYNPFRYRGYYYDIETGYYYLQSRYYNPVWGRFINSDEVTYLGANGDLQAFNLFTYCSNNSVVGYDPTGKWTFSIGWSFSAFLLGGATYSISLAFDSSGNIALQTTKADVFQKESGGTFGIVAAGVSKSYSYTSLDTIEDLEGAALNTGGSIPVYGPLSAGGEVISSPSAPTEVVGGNISIGVGVGIDAHVTASVTNTVAQFNIIDGAKNVWNMATGWIGGWLFA